MNKPRKTKDHFFLSTLYHLLILRNFLGESTFGPLTFRTWDFGGQREYYATHQYFLSRRSLYVLVWKVTDGEAALPDLRQWLVNIQVRSLNFMLHLSSLFLVLLHFI